MIYTVERTTDRDAVRAVLLHPEIWPWVHEDHETDFEPDFDRAFFLLCKHHGETIGVVQFEPVGNCSLNGHYAFLPSGWGKPAFQLASNALAWAFVQQRAYAVIGVQPTCNRRALAFTKRLGFKERNRVSKAWLKDGKRWDLIVFEKIRKRL